MFQWRCESWYRPGRIRGIEDAPSALVFVNKRLDSISDVIVANKIALFYDEDKA